MGEKMNNKIKKPSETIKFSDGKSKAFKLTVIIPISITTTVVLNNVNKPVYAAITGDQVAVTNIRVNKA